MVAAVAAATELQPLHAHPGLMARVFVFKGVNAPAPATGPRSVRDQTARAHVSCHQTRYGAAMGSGGSDTDPLATPDLLAA